LEKNQKLICIVIRLDRAEKNVEMKLLRLSRSNPLSVLLEIAHFLHSVK